MPSPHQQLPIYFDNNASTPLHDSVKQAMIDYLHDPSAIGNPSLPHWAGLGAKKALEHARCQVARYLNADSDEIVFTSGGTESNNHALYGAAFNSLASAQPKKHIITSLIEHPATLKPLEDLAANHGFEVSYLTVDEEGFFDVSELQKLVRSDTLMVSLMHANNEFGSIQPLAEIGRWCRHNDILFHVDAVCSAGKIEVDVASLNADMLSLSAHKFYGPKGIGALYIRRAIDHRISPILFGAGQQQQRRSGTDNVILAVGMGEACSGLQQKNIKQVQQQLAQLRDSLWQQLAHNLGDNVVLNGSFDNDRRLCNTLNCSFVGYQGLALLTQLGGDLAFTAGKACSGAINHLGKPAAVAAGSVRFSLGVFNHQAEVDHAAALIIAALTSA
jgi:cysteine desulfurase